MGERKHSDEGGADPAPDLQDGRILFVSRHPGATEWALRRGIVAQHVAHLDPDCVQEGDLVIGTLPVHVVADVLARRARFVHLALDQPSAARGVEHGADALEAMNARLLEVANVELAPWRAGQGEGK